MRTRREFFDFYFEPHAVRSTRSPTRRIASSPNSNAKERFPRSSPRTSTGCTRWRAASNVFELHGSSLRNHCIRCRAAYTLEEMVAAHERSDDGVPRCDCGGVIRPDVVLYEEALDQDTLRGAVKAIKRADLLLVAGTSLAVYPAAGLIDYFARLPPRHRQPQHHAARSAGRPVHFRQHRRRDGFLAPERRPLCDPTARFPASSTSS